MLYHWAILTVALLLAAYLYSGIVISNLVSAIVAAAVLGVLNTLVRPVLQILALPLTLLTLGLFYFVVNGLVLYLATWLVAGFAVRSFGAAILGSLLVSLFSLVLDALFRGRQG